MDKRFSSPAAITNERMLAWTPEDGTNADELGEWFQGDIMLPAGEEALPPRMKNGIIDQRYRWTNGIIPYEIDPSVCKWNPFTSIYLHLHRSTSISRQCCIHLSK